MSQASSTSRPPARVRQSDVARAAGVSQATVSVALTDPRSGTTRIPDHTRDRVRAIATELGYVVNPAARSLSGGRNRLLGVHTFEPAFPVDAHDFYQEFLVGIERGAESAGYDLLLSTSATGPGRRRSVYAGGVNRLALADGSILLGRKSDPGDLARLVAESFPFVFIGRREFPAAGVSFVTADYHRATTDVLQRLVALEHDRIAYVGREQPLAPDLERRRAWEDFAPWLRAGRLFPSESGLTIRLARALLGEGFTAVVLEAPEQGVSALTSCQHAGIDVPHDLSIAMLGNLPSVTDTSGITGFRIPRQSMGMAAVELLIDRLEHHPDAIRSVQLPCPLEQGHTTTRPGGTR
ncbi:MAG: LacI family DNA-binding transcriptional regulator [Propioniciclava sp.]